MARAANFHLVGPNCMGIFSPKAGVRQNAEQYADTVGPIGFISQSGNHAVNFAQEAHIQGVDVNKLVSYGNGIVLDSADYLEYFAADPETHAVVLFCEPGGTAEEVLAEEVKTRGFPIPVVAFVAGRFADGIPGVRFGHAAAIVEGERGSTRSKIAAFRESGIPVAEAFFDIVTILKPLLGARAGRGG